MYCQLTDIPKMHTAPIGRHVPTQGFMCLFKSLVLHTMIDQGGPVMGINHYSSGCLSVDSGSVILNNCKLQTLVQAGLEFLDTTRYVL